MPSNFTTLINEYAIINLEREERGTTIIFIISLIVIGIFCVLVAGILKGWKRVIPLLVGALIIVATLGVQHSSYEKQVSAAYHQVDVTQTQIAHDRSQIFHNRAKIIQKRNRLQLQSVSLQHNKSHRKQNRAKYQRLLDTYHRQNHRYRKSRRLQDIKLHEARRTLYRTRHKLHQLSVK